MRGSLLCKTRLAIFACVTLLTATCALAQGPATIDAPRYHAATLVRGQNTLTQFALDISGKRIIDTHSKTTALKFPSLEHADKLELLGVYDSDDHITAVLDAPEQRPDPPGGFTHHLQMWRSIPGGNGRLFQEAAIDGGRGAKVRFFSAHEALVSTANAPRLRSNRPPEAFISVMNTTDYDDVYLLNSATLGAATKLFSAWDYDLVDLGHDGKFEIVAWQRMTYDLNCNFVIESEHTYPEVYAQNSSGDYAKIWPPSTWKNPTPDQWHAERGKNDGREYQLQGTFADLRGDGKFELVVLVNRAIADHTQSLNAYELKNGSFVQMATAPLPSQKIAFMINRTTGFPGEPHIIFRAATPQKCTDGGGLDDAGTSELTYRYSDGSLSPSRPYIGVK